MNRLFLTRYTLANGSRGTLHVMAHTSCDAILRALDLFGDRLRRVSARSAT